MKVEYWCLLSFAKNSKRNANSDRVKFEHRSNQTFPKILKLEMVKKKKNFSSFDESEILIYFIENKFPFNFIFEIKKTTSHFSKIRKGKLFLQLPDGLESFSFFLNNIFNSTCSGVEEIWIGSRPTYGACCINDYLTKSVGGSCTLHYGHSCLFPVTECLTPIFFVFLEIKFDFSFLKEIFGQFFKNKNKNFGLISTIQFVSSLKNLNYELSRRKHLFFIPQVKPLSPGEILGCTSPIMEQLPNILYIGDGRFHLESVMLANLTNRFLQFDPFSQSLNLVGYKGVEILTERKNLILKSIFNSKKVGLIIGSLGRQGNYGIFQKLNQIFELRNLSIIKVITPEVSFDKLDFLGKDQLDLWTQIACPRLSLDWSNFLLKPILTPYETSVLFRFAFWESFLYPMDYYSQKSGFWGNYHQGNSWFKKKKILRKSKLELYIFYSVSHF